jgi:hypothetical protein
MPTGDINRAARHIKRLSQKTHQLVVGSAINWRRGDSNAQGAVMLADKYAA